MSLLIIDLIFKCLPLPCRVHLLKQDEAPPGGCTMATVGHSCEVHLLVKGLIDVAKESARLEDMVTKITTQLEKLAEVTSREGYIEKVG